MTCQLLNLESNRVQESDLINLIFNISASVHFKYLDTMQPVSTSDFTHTSSIKVKFK